MDVPRSKVSKQIQALEEAIGVTSRHESTVAFVERTLEQLEGAQEARRTPDRRRKGPVRRSNAKGRSA